jgi:two-component system nitrogen regulation response regulator GlnG
VLKTYAKGGLKMIKVMISDDSVKKNSAGELYKSVIQAIEKPLIEHTLQRTEGNQIRAAKILGINRNTIRSKIKKLGIDPKRWKVQV